MSCKRITLGTILIFIVLMITFLATIGQTILQTVNPFAALTAVTVALIGIVWFKKTSG